MTIAAGKEREWTYEELIELARATNEELDTRRFTLGDIANVIAVKYSEHTIADMAKEIGQSRSALYQYASVAKFYGVELRAKIKEELPNLTYTYLRDAMRLGSLSDAFLWLVECSDLGYTADQAAYELTKKLGHETSRQSAEGIVWKTFSQNGMDYVTVQLADGQKIAANQKVTIKVK